MKFVPFLSIIMLCGCSVFQATEFEYSVEHHTALENFTYVKDIEDTWLVYTSIYRPFAGDCEDFAFTLQNKIGGTVMRVYHRSEGYHAVLLNNGVVYDNLYKYPTPLVDYPAVFYNEMSAKSNNVYVINNK